MVLFAIDTIQLGVNALPDSIQSMMVSELPRLGDFLAQMVRDPDVLGQIQRAFQYFIKSGQVWALFIGFVFGYMFRSFTAY